MIIRKLVDFANNSTKVKPEEDFRKLNCLAGGLIKNTRSYYNESGLCVDWLVVSVVSGLAFLLGVALIICKLNRKI